MRDGGVLCTFRTRTSATAAEFARSSQLQTREGGTVRQGRRAWTAYHNTNLTRLAAGLLSSQPGGLPCWVISLAFGLIVRDMQEMHGRGVVLRARVCKRLRSPGINSEESIPRRAGNRFLGSLKGLQMRDQLSQYAHVHMYCISEWSYLNHLIMLIRWSVNVY